MSCHVDAWTFGSTSVGRCVGTIDFTLAAVALTPATLTEDGKELRAEFRLADGDQITGVLADPDFGESGRYPLRPGRRVEIEFQRWGLDDDTWKVWDLTEQPVDR